jgi:hypothetical protein
MVPSKKTNVASFISDDEFALGALLSNVAELTKPLQRGNARAFSALLLAERR